MVECDTISEANCALPDEVVEEIIAGVRPVCPTRLALFGSAVELGLKANDIDLLILSDDFRGVRFDMRRSLLRFPEDLFIDLWLYTPTEFDKIHPEESQFRRRLDEESVDLLHLMRGD
ncbi:hypothetical protein [Halopiger thermotolerans]